MSRWFTSFKVFGYVIVLLMLGAMAYVAVMSWTHYNAIAV